MDFFEIKETDNKIEPEIKKSKLRSVDMNLYASDFFDGDSVAWDFDTKKQEFIDHMDFLKSLTVQESTLYKKWIQLRSLDTSADIINTGILQNVLWTPADINHRDNTIKELEASLASEKRDHSKTMEQLNEQIDDALDDGEFISVTLKRTQRALDKCKHKYSMAKGDISKRRAKIIKLKGMYKKLDHENKYLSDRILQFEYNSE